jgi:hypothetical protein
MSYKIPVFLSYPKPFVTVQQNFIGAVQDYLSARGFIGRTLGVTDYDMEEPLTAIRRLMLECNGLITIAFRRYQITTGMSKPDSDCGESSASLNGTWLTSAYCQIEPAMAFQIGLPVLVFREKGVLPDGLLEKGVIGTYLPEFDLSRPVTDYFASEEWKQIIGKWEGYSRTVVDNKGKPPKLY